MGTAEGSQQKGELRQGADSIIASAHQGGRAVDKKEALLLPRRPRGGSLFMHPACYVIDPSPLDLCVRPPWGQTALY